MAPLLLSGTEPAQALIASLEERVQALKPALTIVQVGDDPASGAYIRAKLKAASGIGMEAEHLRLPEATTFEELAATVQRLNADGAVSGFIVQSPLPPALHPRFPEIMRLIDPAKDVDGFTAYNLGKVLLSSAYEHLPPATAAGVIHLLGHYQIPVEGKHAVIVGRSQIVGKPLSAMLLNRSATVTVCHSKTPDLAEHTLRADILISAVGKPKLIGADMVKPGSVVIDVGITREAAGLAGDVDFETVKGIASAITPVPGGVGPLTVACLLRNCVVAKERRMRNA